MRQVVIGGEIELVEMKLPGNRIVDPVGRPTMWIVETRGDCGRNPFVALIVGLGEVTSA
jgi:hypothetical protein